MIAEAVLASVKAVVENVDDEKYLPSGFSDYPSEVTLWDKSKMPNVSSKGLFERPIDYTRLFVRDPEKSDHQSIAYESVPELIALKNWIIDQSDLVELLAPPRVPERKEFDLEEVPLHAAVVEDQAFDLALEIVDHLAHTSGLDPVDEGRVLELAQSVAFGLVGSEPMIEIVAPVLLTRFDIEEQVELSAGLYIEKLSDRLFERRHRQVRQITLMRLSRTVQHTVWSSRATTSRIENECFEMWMEAEHGRGSGSTYLWSVSAP